jgi:hypothetical protein
VVIHEFGGTAHLPALASMCASTRQDTRLAPASSFALRQATLVLVLHDH